MFSMPVVQLFCFAALIALCCCANLPQDQYYIGQPITTTEPNPYAQLCADLKPQHSLDIEQIMGVWHGSEIIMHTQDFPGVYKYSSCVTVRLADITEQYRSRQRGSEYYQHSKPYGAALPSTTPAYVHEDYLQESNFRSYLPTRYLRLVWSERNDDLEYTFNYTAYKPGHWLNVGEQHGSFIMSRPYVQFQGSVQVIKAVSDHLVLTFCGSDASSSMYTIVLSRSKAALTEDELRSIRKLLSRRGLYTESVRKVCTSGCESLLQRSTQIYVALLAGLVYVVRKQDLIC